jgi:hypothetical protein
VLMECLTIWKLVMVAWSSCRCRPLTRRTMMCGWCWDCKQTTCITCLLMIDKSMMKKKSCIVSTHIHVALCLFAKWTKKNKDT